MTDALRLLTESGARFGGGSYLRERFADLLLPGGGPAPNGEELAAAVLKKAGLVVKGNESV